MVAQHRALAHLTRHSKILIHPSCKGTKCFRILGFLSGQAGLSVVGRATHGLTTWASEAMKYLCFKHWMSHVSLLVCFRLSVHSIRCWSHLARPCEVFHSWGGKMCGTLIEWSRDAWPESIDTARVMMSTRIGKCDWNQHIRPESRSPTRVAHTIGVASSDRSWAYDRSSAYDRSRDILAL
jgi:hypothetical protein